MHYPGCIYTNLENHATSTTSSWQPYKKQPTKKEIEGRPKKPLPRSEEQSWTTGTKPEYRNQGHKTEQGTTRAQTKTSNEHMMHPRPASTTTVTSRTRQPDTSQPPTP